MNSRMSKEIKKEKNRSKLFNVADNKWGHPESVASGSFLSAVDGATAFAGAEGLDAEGTDAYQNENYIKQIRDVYEQAALEEWKKCVYSEYFTDHGCPEEPDAKPVRILVRTPDHVKDDERLPVIFDIPGGGLAACGTPETTMTYANRYITEQKLRVIHVSFQYRLAPGNPYPAAINDGHAAYLWMLENADKLHINTDAIVITGSSSGGNLCLSLGFRLKRYNWCGSQMPRGIVPISPIMDDVAFNQSNLYSFDSEMGHLSCDRFTLAKPWKWWLGDRYGDPNLSPEAVPNRATAEDIKGYPPVWFPVMPEFDPGRDSGYEFAKLLHNAGIFCDLHVWGASSHTVTYSTGEFEKRIWAVIGGAMRDATTFDFRRQWLLEQDK